MATLCTVEVCKFKANDGSNICLHPNDKRKDGDVTNVISGCACSGCNNECGIIGFR